MQKRPSIALAMIVRNEAHHLPELLKSVEGCFDEIHITDTGSDDGTPELAESLGCVVHRFEWCDDFAEARNYAFSHPKTDYIMWMDGDDVLSNREQFITFRDQMLNEADMWLANYWYATDVNGQPTCIFTRERIVRNDGRFHWKYFIHEGIVAKPNLAKPPITQFTPQWQIVHKRTEQDLQGDRSRNLFIIEDKIKRGVKLDARMRYYYGKELFENGKHVDAIAELKAAAADRTLEGHDRVMALQFMAQAYMMSNQPERTIDVAHTALQLAPTRAEFHVMIADAYASRQKLHEAIPFYEAARMCVMPQSHGMSAIFSNPLVYGPYPTEKLIQVFMTLGQFDRAKAYLEQGKQDFGMQSPQIEQELERIQYLQSAYKTAPECDDIVITCVPGMGWHDWDYDSYHTKMTGGSETAAIWLAHWIKAKEPKRNVIVFGNVKQSKIAEDGVRYEPSVLTADYMAKHKPWLHIAWRHNNKITDATTIAWSHDIYIQGMEDHGNYDALAVLSGWQERFIKSQAPSIPSDKVWVTRNGIVSELFQALEKREKKKHSFVWSSSPDRGLEFTMLVLDEVRKRGINATLDVFYGLEHFAAYGRQKQAEMLKKMMADRPWVTYHGGVPQSRLREELQDKEYWLYPTRFLETFCITALEMLASGVYPISRATAGLQDTLKPFVEAGCADLLEYDTESEKDVQAWANIVEARVKEEAHTRVKLDLEHHSWERVATEWLEKAKELNVLRRDGQRASAS